MAPKPPGAVVEKRGLYRQLADPYEIRILELKPGKDDERLRGALHHCSVEFATDICEPVWYTALSYTWGKNVFNRVIECDNFSKTITESLEVALRQFRRPDYSIMLWIDQICINQDDQEEKSRQIPLMSRIYKHALNTIGWLGLSTPQTGSVLQLLEHTITKLQFIESVTCPDDFEELGLPTAESILWKEIWDFVSRPWFKRLWVIQEMTLAKDLWLMCGSHIATFDIVSTACTNLASCGVSRWLNQNYAADTTDDSCKWICDISIVKTDIQEGQRCPFFWLLCRTRDALCFDPKDKVYGILGICDLSNIRIDYSDEYPVFRLYHDVALRQLSEGSYSRIVNKLLHVVDHTSLPCALPSWVPDWSYALQTVTLGSHSSSYTIYNVAGDTEADFSLGGEKDSKLNVSGIFFDVLDHLNHLFYNPDITYRNPLNENRDLRTCIELCKDLNEYPGGSTVFDAFWHTLVVDKDGTGMRRSPDSFAEIFSLLSDESSGISPTLPGQTYTARQKGSKGQGKLTLAYLSSRTQGQVFQDMRAALQNAMRNRRLGITSEGLLGLFPSQTQHGDTVCIFRGCHVPFVVRVSDGRTVRLIGECYVHGIMKGEVVKREGFSWGSVTII
ncbi:heterokaryon incompatibility protein-domain-containing protein [Daldinia bambusicola]|nr:heterokaryon incompatibility protein-domain-containing protein [Daldinia bambusicola]